MSDERLELTTYFGERDRVDGRLLADVLFDLYETRGIDASILLRAAEGFGLRHHLRTDRLLTLSEDLPLMSIATDLPERLRPVADEVLELKRNGLATLETVHDADADLAGDVRLDVVVGRAERVGRRSAIVAACELLHRRGIAGATALLGVDGTRAGQRSRARFLATNTHVPATVVAVGTGEHIAGVLPELRRMLPRAELRTRSVTLLKRDGRQLAELPSASTGWCRLTLCTSESALVDGRPTTERVVRELRREGITGATVLRGIWGYHGDHDPHGDRLLQLRRHVPAVLTSVGPADDAARAYALIDRLTPERGLVTIESLTGAISLSDEERRGSLAPQAGAR